MEKINNFDGPPSQTDQNKERTRIHTFWNERGEVITETTETKRIVNQDYEQWYGNALDKLSDTDKFLESHSLPKLNVEDRENLNGQTINNEGNSRCNPDSSQQSKAQAHMASRGSFTTQSKHN